MTSESLSKLIEEARALLSNVTPEPLTFIRYEHGGARLYKELERTLVADFYDEGNREFYRAAPRLVQSLVDQLQEQVTLNQTQAQSISTCHAQLKIQKEAIEAAIKVLRMEFPGSIKRKAVIAKLEDSITPKGETQS